ncbi:MAG: bidirectional hydrogenase complex protein HoxE [Anaerolineales bacterium]|nr:bidirectional hydrogenase complex protein HoxE [Anaerolineales bacterium]
MPVTAPPKAEARAADHPSGDPRFKLVDRTIKKFNAERDALLEVLNTAQEVFGFLSEDLMIYVAQQLRVPLARVYGVATFYHMFTFKPLGEHTCIVCLGTACYVKQSGEIMTALEQEFAIKAGQTTPDKKLSLAQARCLGSCGLAPVLVVDGQVVGRETPGGAVQRARALAGKAEVSA